MGARLFRVFVPVCGGSLVRVVEFVVWRFWRVLWLSGRGPFCVSGRVSGVGEGVAGVFGRVAGRFCWFSVFFAVCGVSQLGVARCRGLVLGLEWGGEVEVV